MAAPLVSAVVPAYNAAGTVRATVESILAQTVPHLEVIVVDDGSTDATAASVEAIADPRVRLVRQANAGVAAARNTGIGEARGSYVALLDADDLWLPHKLARQLAHLDRRPDLGVVAGGALYVDDALEVVDIRPCFTPVDPLLESLRFQNLPSFPSTVLMRRTAIERIGLFDTDLVILEDWEYAVRSARHGLLGVVEEPVTLYRVHLGNRSRDLDIHIEPGFRVLHRLFADPSLREDVRRREREIYARFFLMLAGGSIRAGDRVGAIRWLARGVGRDPRTLPYALALPARRLARKAVRHQRRRVDVSAGPCPRCDATAPLRAVAGDGIVTCAACGSGY